MILEQIIEIAPQQNISKPLNITTFSAVQVPNITQTKNQKKNLLSLLANQQILSYEYEHHK